MLSLLKHDKDASILIQTFSYASRVLKVPK